MIFSHSPSLQVPILQIPEQSIGNSTAGFSGWVKRSFFSTFQAPFYAKSNVEQVASSPFARYGVTLRGCRKTRLGPLSAGPPPPPPDPARIFSKDPFPPHPGNSTGSRLSGAGAGKQVKPQPVLKVSTRRRSKIPEPHERRSPGNTQEIAQSGLGRGNC